MRASWLQQRCQREPRWRCNLDAPVRSVQARGGGTWRAAHELMVGFTARSIAVATMLVIAEAASSCYVEEVPPPAYAYGYEPAYYDGYVVYYDDVGRPYYYVDGAVVWIAPGVPEYPRLVAHWRTYGPAYHPWYVHDGYRYRGYRGRR